MRGLVHVHTHIAKQRGGQQPRPGPSCGSRCVYIHHVLAIRQDKYTGDSCLCGHQAAARVSGVSISMAINQSHVPGRPITAGRLLLRTKRRGTLGFAFHNSCADHLDMVL